MPKECQCEIALREHIPVRSLVWLIVSFYHRDDAAIIAELTCDVPYLTHPNQRYHSDLLTAADRDACILRHRGRITARSCMAKDVYADRWIFEVGLYGSFVHFQGLSFGTPADDPCSRCILTVVDGTIVVEIDNVLLTADPRGDFGSHLGTPFRRDFRAGLRAKMYNLMYLEPDDPQHTLFDKMCDLAHETIWGWIH